MTSPKLNSSSNTETLGTIVFTWKSQYKGYPPHNRILIQLSKVISSLQKKLTFKHTY